MLILFLASNIAISLIALVFIRYGKANNISKLVASLFALIAWALPLPYIHYLFPAKLSAEIIKLAPTTFEAEYITSIGLVSSNSHIFTLTNVFILVSIIGIINFSIKLFLHWKVQARIKTHQQAKFIGAKSGVKIYSSPEVKTGLLTGFLWPSIWINPDMLNSESYELIVAHELIHKKLGDNYWIFMIELIRSLYWWNPLVWIVSKKSYLLLEARCDLLASKEFGAGKYRSGLAKLLYTGAFEDKGYLFSKASSNSINLQRLIILKEKQTMKAFTKLIFISTLVLLTVTLSFSVVIAKSLTDNAGSEMTAEEFKKEWKLVSVTPPSLPSDTSTPPKSSQSHTIRAEIRDDGKLYNVQILKSQGPISDLTEESIALFRSSKFEALHPNAKTGTVIFEVEAIMGDDFSNMSLEMCESLKAAILKAGREDVKLPAGAPCQID